MIAGKRQGNQVRSSRRKFQELQAVRERNARMVNEIVAQYVAGAPATYPDGSPFPATEAIGALGQTALSFSEVSHPDRDAIVNYLQWMMALFNEVATTELTPDTIQIFHDTRVWLGRHGYTEAQGVVRQAGLDLMKYWEQNGAQDRMIRAAMSLPDDGKLP
ncbi:hypothetical protein ACFTSF_04655 [Kribbella sp. NPDC056951]|uniref:hypothetical protein n=1 Tax=Kribbella sp. NPDC056951 TaxID=3345978 RepID=UPI003634284E